jgi:2-(1,2-epoxy-1,2-dihydrophenyl)acetyl-CoA isomerase
MAIATELETVREFETVVMERDGGMAQLRLNRPDRLNSLIQQVYLDMLDGLALAAADKTIRSLVITGTGERAFCAGGDMKLDLAVIADYGPTQLLEECKESQDMVRAIRDLPKPVIARVNGVAVGGGCDLALCCDIVIAATNASFGEFWVRRGIIPDMGGAFLLPRLVGTHRAKELLFTGDRIDAEEAARIGLINRVVAPEDLDDAAYGMARRLANMPTVAIGAIKELVHREPDIDQYFETARHALFTMTHTDDHKEGVKAFEEKREPAFKGR